MILLHVFRQSLNQSFFHTLSKWYSLLSGSLFPSLLTLSVLTLCIGCQDHSASSSPMLSFDLKHTQSRQTEVVQKELKILPLGDSRVEGNRPEYESYRYELWKHLTDASFSFDFIGPLSDEADYPSFNGYRFDPDHAGVGGFTTEDILLNLPEWIDDIESPDVVLLGIGGNDLLGQSPLEEVISNLYEIIAILQQKNPEVIILLEQIAPARSDLMNSDFEILLNQFHQSLIDIQEAHQSDSLSPILLVDLFTGWNDGYLADEVHYNEGGSKVVAERYYTILSEQFGLSALPPGECP